MALIPLITPQFPSVASFPGVPALQRVQSVVNTVQSAALAINKLTAGPPPVWGVYDQKGKIALQPDSIIDMDYNNERRTPDYPIEEGAFGTYNKVANPYEYHVGMTKGGTLDEKIQFLVKVEAMLDDLNLYMVLTPEFLYDSVNLVGLRISRKRERGVQLIFVETTFKEIRVIDAGTFTKSKDPSGATTTNNGPVSPSTPTAGQQRALANNDGRGDRGAYVLPPSSPAPPAAQPGLAG